jgi:hypothetical protein
LHFLDLSRAFNGYTNLNSIFLAALVRPSERKRANSKSWPHLLPHIPYSEVASPGSIEDCTKLLARHENFRRFALG